MTHQLTPGPWRIRQRASGNVEDGNGRSIATCHGYSTNTDNGEHIKENNANAQLIASAPDLLFVLEQIIDALPTHKDWLDPQLEAIARSTIKEATRAHNTPGHR